MKVKSVTYAGKSDVYNMSVEDTHSFHANGVVISNSYDELRYFCMARPVPLRHVESAPKLSYDPFRRYRSHE